MIVDIISEDGSMEHWHGTAGRPMDKPVEQPG